MRGGRTIVDSKHRQQVLGAYLDIIPKLRNNPKTHSIIIIITIIMMFENGCEEIMQFLASTEPIADRPIFSELQKVPLTKSLVGMADYPTIAQDIE